MVEDLVAPTLGHGGLGLKRACLEILWQYGTMVPVHLAMLMVTQIHTNGWRIPQLERQKWGKGCGLIQKMIGI